MPDKLPRPKAKATKEPATTKEPTAEEIAAAAEATAGDGSTVTVEGEPGAIEGESGMPVNDRSDQALAAAEEALGAPTGKASVAGVSVATDPPAEPPYEHPATPGLDNLPLTKSSPLQQAAPHMHDASSAFGAGQLANDAKQGFRVGEALRRMTKARETLESVVESFDDRAVAAALTEYLSARDNMSDAMRAFGPPR